LPTLIYHLFEDALNTSNGLHNRETEDTLRDTMSNLGSVLSRPSKAEDLIKISQARVFNGPSLGGGEFHLMMHSAESGLSTSPIEIKEEEDVRGNNDSLIILPSRRKTDLNSSLMSMDGLSPMTPAKPRAKTSRFGPKPSATLETEESAIILEEVQSGELKKVNDKDRESPRKSFANVEPKITMEEFDKLVNPYLRSRRESMIGREDGDMENRSRKHLGAKEKIVYHELLAKIFKSERNSIHDNDLPGSHLFEQFCVIGLDRSDIEVNEEVQNLNHNQT
jgi:hypothetical protein